MWILLFYQALSGADYIPNDLQGEDLSIMDVV